MAGSSGSAPATDLCGDGPLPGGNAPAAQGCTQFAVEDSRSLGSYSAFGPVGLAALEGTSPSVVIGYPRGNSDPEGFHPSGIGLMKLDAWTSMAQMSTDAKLAPALALSRAGGDAFALFSAPLKVYSFSPAPGPRTLQLLKPGEAPGEGTTLPLSDDSTPLFLTDRGPSGYLVAARRSKQPRFELAHVDCGGVTTPVLPTEVCVNSRSIDGIAFGKAFLIAVTSPSPALECGEPGDTSPVSHIQLYSQGAPPEKAVLLDEVDTGTDIWEIKLVPRTEGAWVVSTTPARYGMARRIDGQGKLSGAPVDLGKVLGVGPLGDRLVVVSPDGSVRIVDESSTSEPAQLPSADMGSAWQSAMVVPSPGGDKVLVAWSQLVPGALGSHRVFAAARLSCSP